MMKTSQEYIRIIQEHQPELQQRFGITSMRIFGSVARGEQKEGSDIDLFVTMPPKMFNYIEAAQFLEQLLGCSVDLIRDHQNLRPFFRQQINKDGIASALILVTTTPAKPPTFNWLGAYIIAVPLLAVSSR